MKSLDEILIKLIDTQDYILRGMKALPNNASVIKQQEINQVIQQQAEIKKGIQEQIDTKT